MRLIGVTNGNRRLVMANDDPLAGAAPPGAAHGETVLTPGDVVLIPVQFVRLQGQHNEDAQITIVESNGKVRQAWVLKDNLVSGAPDPIADAERAVIDTALARYEGAETMREACLALVRPIGEYSNTPEMQAILRLRTELEQLICNIPMDWLVTRRSKQCPQEPAS